MPNGKKSCGHKPLTDISDETAVDRMRTIVLLAPILPALEASCPGAKHAVLCAVLDLCAVHSDEEDMNVALIQLRDSVDKESVIAGLGFSLN